MTNVLVRTAQLAQPQDAADVLRLLEHYSENPWGANAPLPPSVRETVVAGLQQHPSCTIFLAELDGVVVGMAICFVGFSTFRAKPLMNIHDLVVWEDARGQGVGSSLIDAAADYARQRDWCALTLEVRSDNPARHLYARKGFQPLSEAAATRGEPQTRMLFGKLEF